MTREYSPDVSERPEHLETKSTVDTLIGYNPAQVPLSTRTGSSLTDDERNDANVVPGTPHAGNGAQRSSGSSGGEGLASDSGGKVTSRRGPARSGTEAKPGEAAKTKTTTETTTETKPVDKG